MREEKMTYIGTDCSVDSKFLAHKEPKARSTNEKQHSNFDQVLEIKQNDIKSKKQEIVSMDAHFTHKNNPFTRFAQRYKNLEMESTSATECKCKSNQNAMVDNSVRSEEINIHTAKKTEQNDVKSKKQEIVSMDGHFTHKDNPFTRYAQRYKELETGNIIANQGKETISHEFIAESSVSSSKAVNNHAGKESEENVESQVAETQGSNAQINHTQDFIDAFNELLAFTPLQEETFVPFA